MEEIHRELEAIQKRIELLNAPKPVKKQQTPPRTRVECPADSEAEEEQVPPKKKVNIKKQPIVVEQVEYDGDDSEAEHEYNKLYGSKQEVYDGLAFQTKGKLQKCDLILDNNVVKSKKASDSAKLTAKKRLNIRGKPLMNPQNNV